MKPNTEQHMHKQMTGKVVSIGTNNSGVVEVVQAYRHPIYRKEIRKHKHIAVDMGSIPVQKGDNVRIEETKPMSRTKHFVIVAKI